MNTILVVEDSEPIAKLLAAGLRRAGHTVHVAGDAMAALQAMRFVKPDLTLLHLGLPGMDGTREGRVTRAGCDVCKVRPRQGGTRRSPAPARR